MSYDNTQESQVKVTKAELDDIIREETTIIKEQAGKLIAYRKPKPNTWLTLGSYKYKPSKRK